MKRRIFAALTLALSAPIFAQDDVLKPFRPAGNPNETPRTVPAKPFRAPEPEIPRAVPVKKPPAGPADPSVIPAPRPMPADPVETAPVRPAPIGSETPRPAARPTTTQRLAPAESLDPGDIVVRSGGAPTSPEQVQLQYADGFYARKMWRDAAPEYERYLQAYARAASADRQAAYYRLAECYRQTDAINNAKANYEAILTNFNGGEFVGYAAYRMGHHPLRGKGLPRRTRRLSPRERSPHPARAHQCLEILRGPLPRIHGPKNRSQSAV